MDCSRFVDQSVPQSINPIVDLLLTLLQDAEKPFPVFVFFRMLFEVIEHLSVLLRCPPMYLFEGLQILILVGVLMFWVLLDFCPQDSTTHIQCIHSSVWECFPKDFKVHPMLRGDVHQSLYLTTGPLSICDLVFWQHYSSFS